MLSDINKHRIILNKLLKTKLISVIKIDFLYFCENHYFTDFLVCKDYILRKLINELDS